MAEHPGFLEAGQFARIIDGFFVIRYRNEKPSNGLARSDLVLVNPNHVTGIAGLKRHVIGFEEHPAVAIRAHPHDDPLYIGAAEAACRKRRARAGRAKSGLEMNGFS